MYELNQSQFGIHVIYILGQVRQILFCITLHKVEEMEKLCILYHEKTTIFSKSQSKFK